MFYDLNVDVAPSLRKEAANTCARLGYGVIAFNTTVNTPKLTAEHSAPSLTEINGADGALPFDPNVLRISDRKIRGRQQIRMLTRITIVVEDNNQLACLSSPILSQYDLVAVAPMTEKIFQQCLQFDVDIICLWPNRQHFFLKRPQVHVAKEKGAVFEICYAPALSDQSSRRSAIASACSLTRATAGKHVILSSAAKASIYLRGPHDVMNLAYVFGLSSEHARNAVTHICDKAVIHGDIRANTHKGVVRCRIKPTEAGDSRMDDTD